MKTESISIRKLGNLICSSQKGKKFKNKLKKYWKHRGDHQEKKDMLGIYSELGDIAITDC